MSGGVDSSVTAYLLKEQGYKVEGLSFILLGAKSRTDIAACSSLQAMEEASKAARHIGIPHSTIDVRNDFLEKVIEPFVDAYISGSTPNPCVLCNRFIKFPFLLKEAGKRGAEYISTGHYARVESAQGMGQRAESFLLKKGLDPKKDQSYVLYVLKQEELKRLILPLGYYNKDEVRKIAQELNLPAAKRAESQELCFIEDRNYFKFIEKLSSVTGKPGPIADMTGKVIGTHKGIHVYTIGQRKGLGISSPEPLYVVKIDAVRNTVYVGPQEAAKKKEFFVKDLNWINPLLLGESSGATIPLFPPLVRGDKEGLKKGGEGGFSNFRASVKVRSTMKDESATVLKISSKTVQVIFDEPQWALTPGQSAVFYDGDTLIGGGVII